MQQAWSQGHAQLRSHHKCMQRRYPQPPSPSLCPLLSGMSSTSVLTRAYLLMKLCNQTKHMQPEQLVLQQLVNHNLYSPSAQVVASSAARASAHSLLPTGSHAARALQLVWKVEEAEQAKAQGEGIPWQVARTHHYCEYLSLTCIMDCIVLALKLERWSHLEQTMPSACAFD